MEDNLLVIYGIYDVRQPNRCRYVGLTSKGVKVRAKGHWDESKRDRYDLPIVRWMRKRQRGDFELRPLEYAVDLDDLKAKERKWIAIMRSDGQADLNITDGGESRAGSKWTDAQKKAKSEAMTGKKNPMYGKTLTPEQNARRIAKLVGKKQSDKQRSMMSDRVRGEGNPAATLSETTVIAIHQAAMPGDFSFSELARSFNTTEAIVAGICSGKSWLHLGLPRVVKTPDQIRASQSRSAMGIKRPISWFHNKYHVRGQSVDTMIDCPACNAVD